MESSRIVIPATPLAKDSQASLHKFTTLPILTYVFPMRNRTVRFALHELAMPEIQSLLKSLIRMYGKPVILHECGIVDEGEARDVAKFLAVLKKDRAA